MPRSRLRSRRCGNCRTPSVPELPGPSRGWYLLAMLLVVLAGIAAAIAIFSSMGAIKFTTVMLPGEAVVEVAEPGDWIVCNETIDGSEPSPPGLHIEFTDDAGSTLLVMGNPSQPLAYRMGEVRGVAVGTVSLPGPGRWTITGRLPDGIDDASVRWRYGVGPDPVHSVFLTMLIGQGIAIVLLVIGLGTWCLVFWRRLKAKGAMGGLA